MKIIKPGKNSLFFPKIEKCKSKMTSSPCRQVLTEWKNQRSDKKKKGNALIIPEVAKNGHAFSVCPEH